MSELARGPTPEDRGQAPLDSSPRRLPPWCAQLVLVASVALIVTRGGWLIVHGQDPMDLIVLLLNLFAGLKR